MSVYFSGTFASRMSPSTGGFLPEVKDDGTAVYLTLNGRRSAVASKDGTIKSALASAGGCDGQTIQELREKGLTVKSLK